MRRTDDIRQAIAFHLCLTSCERQRLASYVGQHHKGTIFVAKSGKETIVSSPVIRNFNHSDIDKLLERSGVVTASHEKRDRRRGKRAAPAVAA